jgi:hypothetical protein
VAVVGDLASRCGMMDGWKIIGRGHSVYTTSHHIRNIYTSEVLHEADFDRGRVPKLLV